MRRPLAADPSGATIAQDAHPLAGTGSLRRCSPARSRDSDRCPADRDFQVRLRVVPSSIAEPARPATALGHRTDGGTLCPYQRYCRDTADSGAGDHADRGLGAFDLHRTNDVMVAKRTSIVRLASPRWTSPPRPVAQLVVALAAASTAANKAARVIPDFTSGSFSKAAAYAANSSRGVVLSPGTRSLPTP